MFKYACKKHPGVEYGTAEELRKHIEKSHPEDLGNADIVRIYDDNPTPPEPLPTRRKKPFGSF